MKEKTPPTTFMPINVQKPNNQASSQDPPTTFIPIPPQNKISNQHIPLVNFQNQKPVNPQNQANASDNQISPSFSHGQISNETRELRIKSTKGRSLKLLLAVLAALVIMLVVTLAAIGILGIGWEL